MATWIWMGEQILFSTCVSGVASCRTLPWDFVPLFVSLGFWSVGVFIWKQDTSTPGPIFFFLCSATLSSGQLSSYDSDLSVRLFYILLAWLSPAFYHFHLLWSLRQPRRLDQTIQRVLFGLGSAWSAPFILTTVATLRSDGWYQIFRFGVRLTISLTLILVISILTVQYRKNHRAPNHRIRLVFSGTLLSFAPLLLLSLLPSLIGADYIPTEANMIWLVFIPLSYVFSISQTENYRMENNLRRGINFYLTGILFIGCYLIAAEVASHLFPKWNPYWGYIIVVAGVIVFFLLTRMDYFTRRFASWILYGSEKSHLDLLAQMTDALGIVLSREKLTMLLLDELASIVPISEIALFLKTPGKDLVLEGSRGFECPDGSTLCVPGHGSLYTILEKGSLLIENSVVRKGLVGIDLSPEERRLTAFPWVGLWIPLVSGDELHGLLLLGRWPVGFLFSQEDRQMWQILAHQAGVATHNVLLAEDLRNSREELARAHQQLLSARETERHQLAGELHDNAIQQLLGISYQAALLQNKFNRKEVSDQSTRVNITADLNLLRQELLQVIAQLRELVGDLRPAGLKEFGLGSALEGFVHKLQHQAGSGFPRVEIKLAQNGQELPEPIAICLFRIAQEAIRNAHKHGQARHICLKLTQDESEVVLEIRDDGCGFQLPGRLSILPRSNHYGLIGISERVAWVNGQLQIRSQPGQGTEISVRIPLKSF
ncbi:MAG: GAF domain-containing sensor histidine kinase [Anaerolineaceae bacterium]|nr:GAF domain-containing sensor histidine kinase [Anaerolineaceae bacterium]